MKLLRFLYKDTIYIGALKKSGIHSAASKYCHEHGMIDFLTADKSAFDDLRQRIETNHHNIAIDDVTLIAPIAKPDKFFGVSLNYDAHIEETDREKPEYSTLFNKQNSCVNDPDGSIHLPAISEKLNYEGELAIVTGTACRYVNYETAKHCRLYHRQ